MTTQRRQEAVRAAGAPMVPRERPPWAPTPQIGDQLREAGGQVLDESRERARAEVDRRSSWAGERVTAIAADVRDVGGDLRARGKDQPARLADEAARRIERFGSYLQRSDTDRIIADARGIARRQPALVIAGAAVIGIAAGRLVKASDPSHGGGNGHG